MVGCKKGEKGGAHDITHTHSVEEDQGEKVSGLRVPLALFYALVEPLARDDNPEKGRS